MTFIFAPSMKNNSPNELALFDEIKAVAAKIEATYNKNHL